MNAVQQHIFEADAQLLHTTWSDKLETLFQNQLVTWQMARNHYRQFASVQRRLLHFNGFRIELQHNPARARSTCANLSQAAIEQRKCFLCAHHLPTDQKGLVLLDKYLLLVNPFPIFERHFTISDFIHTPQTIQYRMPDMLAIARQLKGFTVFYNGPRCGASAPDHFHFQAVPFGQMPIDTELDGLLEKQGSKLLNVNDTPVWQISNYLRATLLIESDDAAKVSACFETLLTQLPPDNEYGEPMMNLLATYVDGKYRLVVFPRKAQRPSCYFRIEDDRILVSPASVELGGIVVSPREEDFLRINNDDIAEIFNDVSLFV